MSKLKKVFVFCFIFSLCIPNFLLFIGIDFNLDENRKLKEKPQFCIDNLYDYPEEYISYYEDNMPFKSLLVKCNSYLNYKLFHVSTEKAVIFGQDGWLFYDSKYKESTDSLGDYINPVDLSIQELEDYKSTFLKMQETCAREGAEFFLVVAPNKMTIYGDEYLPAYYSKNEEGTRTDFLLEYLRNNTDLNIVYPKEALLGLRDQIQLYYKLDTHWNALGGYIGYSELYQSVFGEESEKIGEIDCISKEVYNGDLSKLLNINVLSDTEYSLNYKPEISVHVVSEDNNIYSYSSNENGHKLLMFRDSFAISMIDYIQRNFEQTHLIWSSVFDENLIMGERPDIVVYEIAERSIPYIANVEHLYSKRPIESERLSSIPLPIETNPDIMGWCEPEEINSVLRLHGFGFIRGKNSRDTRAIIMLSGETTYEIPFELEYRSDVADADNLDGSVLYCGIDVKINIDDIADGDYDVYMLMENSGIMYWWNMNYEINK